MSLVSFDSRMDAIELLLIGLTTTANDLPDFDEMYAVVREIFDLIDSLDERVKTLEDTFNVISETLLISESQ